MCGYVGVVWIAAKEDDAGRCGAGGAQQLLVCKPTGIGLLLKWLVVLVTICRVAWIWFTCLHLRDVWRKTATNPRLHAWHQRPPLWRAAACAAWHVLQCST